MVTSASRAALEEARDAGAVEALTHLTRASPSADAKDAAVEALRNFSAPPVRGVTPRVGGPIALLVWFFFFIIPPGVFQRRG